MPVSQSQAQSRADTGNAYGKKDSFSPLKGCTKRQVSRRSSGREGSHRTRASRERLSKRRNVDRRAEHLKAYGLPKNFLFIFIYFYLFLFIFIYFYLTLLARLEKRSTYPLGGQNSTHLMNKQIEDLMV